MTEAERRLWRRLRELALPHRFRRQHPIGTYLVDFACPTAKLAIELMADSMQLVPNTDQNRSTEIARHGYRVIRFWNGDVMENIEGVLETIKRELEISLSALGGGEGRGEVGGSAATPIPGATHLTLPMAKATGPLPLRPQGRRGR